MLAGDPRAPISAPSRSDARRIHVADSLTGLELESVRDARLIGDLGAGAGLPGLVLAAALPQTEVELIEAAARKCAFIREAIDAMELDNARVVNSRAEAWALEAGRERYEVVTARAVAGLATLAELASPLLGPGGALVAWKGERDEAELERARSAAERTAMEPRESVAVQPYPGSRNHRLDVLVKVAPTPSDLPRRDGMAAKRPFGSVARRAPG